MTRVLLCSAEPILAKGLELVLRAGRGIRIASHLFFGGGAHRAVGERGPRRSLARPHTRRHIFRPHRAAAIHDRVQDPPLVNSIPTELAFQAMGLGIRGILRKTLPPELQVKCLVKVEAGELWFEKALTDSFLTARRVALTCRESQLISLPSQGLKNKEIATNLMISEGTVKVYLSRLFQKVGVKDRFEVALFGLKNLTTGQAPLDTGDQRQPAGSLQGLRSLVLDKPADRTATPTRFPSSLLSETRYLVSQFWRIDLCITTLCGQLFSP